MSLFAEVRHCLALQDEGVQLAVSALDRIEKKNTYLPFPEYILTLFLSVWVLETFGNIVS